MLRQETYIGLDAHKEKIYGTALSKKGEVLCSYEFPSSKEAIKEFLKSFQSWNTFIAISMWNLERLL
jgi:hypothetical protein